MALLLLATTTFAAPAAPTDTPAATPAATQAAAPTDDGPEVSGADWLANAVPVVYNGQPARIDSTQMPSGNIYRSLPGVTDTAFAGTLMGDVTLVVDGVAWDRRGFLHP